MKRAPILLIILGALVLSGCGTPRPAGIEVSTDQAGPAPLDAALVTPTFGWVLTPDQLLTTDDGGATLTAVNVPVPADPARAAYFADTKAGAVAAAAVESITVATTGDGGRTWRTATARDPAASPAGYSALSLSFGDAKHGAIVARTATSQAFSLGTLFATVDGGATWTAGPAPEAGRVSVEPGGRIWLAGANLQSSSDQGRTWTRAELRLAGAGTVAAVSPPVGGTLPVTVVSGDQTEENFRRSWRHTLTGSGPTPEDIAAAVEFIWRTASINGEIIVLDGGQRLMSMERDVAFVVK